MVLLKTTISTVQTLLQYIQIVRKQLVKFLSYLAKIVFPPFKKGKILEINDEVWEEKLAVPKGMWVLQGGNGHMWS